MLGNIKNAISRITWIAYCTIAVLIMSGCQKDELVVEKTKLPFQLKSMDLSNAYAIFQHQGEGPYNLFKIDNSGNVAPIPLTVEGDYTEEDLMGFEMSSVGNTNYILLSSRTLKQTYFVDKLTGEAIQSIYLEFGSLLNGNLEITCTKEACYYQKSFTEFLKISNYLSTDAHVDMLMQINGSIIIDKDDKIIVNDLGDLYAFDEGELRLVSGTSIASWMDADGYLRTVDDYGNVSKIVNYELQYEGWMQYNVANINPFVFPLYDKTYGLKYSSGAFRLFELRPAFTYRADFPAPAPPDENTQMITAFRSDNNYLYILSSAQGMNQLIRKIDVTDFSSIVITTTSTDRILYSLPFTDGRLLVIISKKEHFHFNDRIALIDSFGNVEFLFDTGNANGGIIKM